MPIILLSKIVPNLNFAKRFIIIDEDFATTRRDIAFGFTLTGHDELEPGASTNAERINAMQKLHEAGFKTWASIEPIIDFGSSLAMILDCLTFCDYFKIGLQKVR